MNNPNYITVQAGRWTGKTTRLIDEAIQELFKGGRIFFPTKQFVEKQNGMIFKTYKSVEGIEKRMLDPDWEHGVAQEDLMQRVLKRLEFEHQMTLQKNCKNENGWSFSLEDFKKGNGPAVIKREYTEIWTVGLLDKERRFVMTSPNLNHPEPEKFLFKTRKEAENHLIETRRNDPYSGYKVYLYAATGESISHLGRRRISPYVDIKDAVAELKKIEDEQKAKS